MTANARTTLWIWPSGLFPRRLVYYFLAKGITPSSLKQHNIDLVPIQLTLSPPTLQALQGHEPRPADASLPILRIAHADGRIVWIRESVSILEYLEELFPSSAGWTDLCGENAEQRAQTRDVVGILNDAMHWSLIWLVHSDIRTTSWSGLAEQDMSPSTARHAEARFHFYLSRLERWVQEDNWSGTKHASLAGLLLLAQVEYYKSTYNSDWIAGYALLGQWVIDMKMEAWAVSSEKLKGPERGEGWAVLFGGT
ncbi:hypothetical protein E8E13_011091 [Curvularia kusanoi]|uniref:GST N-terminal domain-containing protein n=1 Tax=Curvularia kusanoi TaxID=90978 RepID=A0A9P4THW8_CURKU|nr:hypothetical protein E8E13_011091 [Curvularia kusanoi]